MKIELHRRWRVNAGSGALGIALFAALISIESPLRAQNAPDENAAPAAAPTSAPTTAPAPASATASAPASDAAPSPAAIFFGKKCGGCHSLGEGDRTGPDLLNVQTRRDRAWITAFIRGAGAVIDAGDPTATELVTKFKGMRMPDQLVGDDEMAALLAYLSECDKKGGCKISTGLVKKATEATPADIAAGRALFEGRTALSNGGAACISCHNVRDVGLLGGGTLAKDLTFAYARLGDVGLSSALDTTPFPIMKDIYAKRTLTQAEAFQLKAFLYASSRDGSQPLADHNFFYLGFGGLGACLGLIGAAWSGRMRGGLRRKFIANHPTRAGRRGAS